MTTMPETSGHSEACCNIPPIVSKGYEAKGKYEDIGGLKTYVTGPDDARKAILMVTDIFGYFPQTLQAADILATSDDHQKYKVLAPDFFGGKPAAIEWYPPTTPEKQQNLGAWFGNNPPAGAAASIPDYIKAVQARFPNLADWGVIGHCWGGKVVSLVTSSDSNPFKAGAACHPAMVDPKEAENVKVPFAMLASKDEPADAVKKFEEALKVPKHVEIFSDQIHGWMAARSDLEDARVREEYTRGYKTVLTFFQKHV